MLRGDPASMTALIDADPALVIFLRPSLVMHFQYLWALDDDRSSFWGTLLA